MGICTIHTESIVVLLCPSYQVDRDSATSARKEANNIMTEHIKKVVSEAKTVEEKIKAVNMVLQNGEPANVSKDTYAGFTGYKPQYIIDAMNVVFTIGGWGFEEISSEIVTNQTEKGSASIAI